MGVDYISSVSDSTTTTYTHKQQALERTIALGKSGILVEVKVDEE